MQNDPSVLLAKFAELKRWTEKDLPRLTARRAEAYTKENWRHQGYRDRGVKKWAKRQMDDRDGAAILIGKQSGALRDSIRATWSAGKVTIESGRVYAQIHNEGGTITQVPTAQQRKFFWAKYYQLKSTSQTRQFKRDGISDGLLNKTEETPDMKRWKAMALARVLHIKMPQRQFMPLPNQGLPFELGEILRGDMEKKMESLF
jgi:phage gpG-like protein